MSSKVARSSMRSGAFTSRPPTRSERYPTATRPGEHEEADDQITCGVVLASFFSASFSALSCFQFPSPTPDRTATGLDVYPSVLCHTPQNAVII